MVKKAERNPLNIDLLQDSLRDEILAKEFKRTVNLYFQKPTLIYMPCYNCAEHVEKTMSEIPQELHDKVEVLVVDNHSEDDTAEAVQKVIEKKAFPFKIHLIRMTNNVGYAGSQKTACALVQNAPLVKNVIMLHGDGQYPPVFLKEFIPYLEQDYAVVNGFRSKDVYRQREETPVSTFMIIKFLSWLESTLVGMKQKEWHSGFVMYSRDFLLKIPLHRLSPYMHIDGEFLLCAGILDEKTASVPIFKRYKDHEAFGGLARLNHVVHVFKIIWRFHRKYYHQFLQSENKSKLNYTYEVLSH